MKPILFILGALLALPLSWYTPLIAVALAGLAMYALLSPQRTEPK